MRILGIDFGEKRLGVAVSDATATIAYPVETVPGSEKEKAIGRIVELTAEREVDRLVIGLPRNMDGSLGFKAKEVLAFVELLRGRLAVPIETWDERLTTVQAERFLREAGVPRARWRERVDQIAAQILLQTWLDGHPGGVSPPPEPELPESDDDSDPDPASNPE